MTEQKSWHLKFTIKKNFRFHSIITRYGKAIIKLNFRQFQGHFCYENIHFSIIFQIDSMIMKTWTYATSFDIKNLAWFMLPDN